MKRKVMYDYKLLTSVAFVSEHWNLVKDRFVRYCNAIEDVSHDEAVRIYEKTPSISDKMKEHEGRPVTTWLHDLTTQQIKVVLQFLIDNEGALFDDFKEFEIDTLLKESGLGEFQKEEGVTVLSSKMNGKKLCNPKETGNIRSAGFHFLNEPADAE
jgi:hypothetical protein